MDSIGSYKLIKSLGKGGMGEVFLAFDAVCQRNVALKRIREDLVKYKTMHDRFLREAHIAAELTHPSIIPILSIHKEADLPYYTMPYVEGKTLKQILKPVKEQESSIPALMRIFLSVCQAIAYCHSRRILHRDLKPENIIVGKFGEVLLLDWGLAEHIGNSQDGQGEEIPSSPDLTRPGKVVGTLAYLAPERAKGASATEQSDLYALGVILYQMLTLKSPFKRADLQMLQKMGQYEELLDPIEAAPHRDIPNVLSDMAKKCLRFAPEERYRRVADLIADLETYIEGRPEWLLASELKIDNKEDWEFQENVLLAKHVAITGLANIMEWVSLMISKASFSGNMKIEAHIRLKENGQGIGFLLNVPEAKERKDLMDGYCLWIGSEAKLFRSNIEVMQAQDAAIERDKWHKVKIEKVDNHVKFFLDDQLKCHYISHTPLAGAHVGLVFRDANFELEHLLVFIGSQSIQVSCLAVPDAFLAGKDYGRALAEYRRIAHSFPGRAEGREAIFRGGVTLLDEGLAERSRKKQSRFLGMALEEFGRLKGTAGAPLEYLGKSLVYKALGEVEEEVKCLELALRKYFKHPLRPRLVEHIVFRLHESSHHDRLAAYHFALLCLRLLPQIFSNPDNRKLIDSLRCNWERLPFFSKECETATAIAFFLAKPVPILEMIECGKGVEDGLWALLELGCTKMLKENPRVADFPDIALALGMKKAEEPLSVKAGRYLAEQSIDDGGPVRHAPDDLQAWALLSQGAVEQAGAILEKYPIEEILQDSSPLFPLYGCYLWKAEGEEIARAHFSGASETPFPRTTALLAHFVLGKLDLKKWLPKSFFWERLELWRYLTLFYRLTGDAAKAAEFEKKLQREKKNAVR